MCVLPALFLKEMVREPRDAGDWLRALREAWALREAFTAAFSFARKTRSGVEGPAGRRRRVGEEDAARPARDDRSFACAFCANK